MPTRRKAKVLLTTGSSNGIGYGMAQATSSRPLRRRFIRVQGRGIHYLRAGDGSPVVLFHSAPLSARAELPLLNRLVRDHTVFAFDNPGFGDCDVLPMPEVRMADVADAATQLSHAGVAATKQEVVL